MNKKKIKESKKSIKINFNIINYNEINYQIILIINN
jgi:hypothetical protein